jgi:hypothetical protein
MQIGLTYALKVYSGKVLEIPHLKTLKDYFRESEGNKLA